jgi:hypothetical protein
MVKRIAKGATMFNVSSEADLAKVTGALRALGPASA